MVTQNLLHFRFSYHVLLLQNLIDLIKAIVENLRFIRLRVVAVVTLLVFKSNGVLDGILLVALLFPVDFSVVGLALVRADLPQFLMAAFSNSHLINVFALINLAGNEISQQI